MPLNEIELTEIKPSEKKQFLEHFSNYLNEIDPKNILKNQYSKIFFDAIQKNPKRFLYWIQFNNENAGFVILLIEKDWPVYNLNKGRISEFYIFPEYRDLKIGESCIVKLVSFFKKNNCHKIELEVHQTNEKGFSFWKNNGFTLKKYFMEKEL